MLLESWICVCMVQITLNINRDNYEVIGNKEWWGGELEMG